MVGDAWGGIRGSNLAEFLHLDHQLLQKWLLEEPVISLTASGICLRIFLIRCSFHHKTEGHVGHSRR